MGRLIFLMMIGATAVGLAAEEPAWNNRVWRSEDGLVDDRIVGVKQSSDGFLWVATVKGVMRFDGLEFSSLAVSSELSSDGKIYALFIDSLDRLWMARRGGEILCVDHGSVVMKIPPEGDGRNPEFPSIIEEKAGELMFCFSNGRFFRVRDGKIEQVREEDPVRGENRQVVKDGLGQIWVSRGDQGFGIIKDGTFSLLESLSVARLAGARSGGVWICSGNELWKYTKAGSLKKICRLPNAWRTVNPTVFFEDRQGGLWFGTEYSGLFHFDNNLFSRVSVSAQKITSIEEDRTGTIWVGTWKGLCQLSPESMSFLKFGTDDQSQNVISLCEDRAGCFWVVGVTGLISKSGNSNLWKSATIESWSQIDAKAVPSAQCVVADPAGGVWIGTEKSGVYRWQDGVVTTNLGMRDGLACESVNALHVSHDGALWIGAGQADSPQDVLQRWQSGRFQSYPLPSTSKGITAILTDVNSNCWCTTYGGNLFRVGGDGMIVDETAKLSPGRYSILSICTTPDGSVWLGFSEQGLGRLKNGGFRRYRMDQGLRENVISRILFDGASRLWIAGNRGIFSVRLDDFDDIDAGRAMRVQSVIYGKNEGLLSSRSTAFFWPGAIFDSAGRLLFGMTGGIAVVNPEDPKNSKPPPPIVIDRVRVDGRTIAVFGADEVFSDPAHPAPVDLRQPGRAHVRVPPGSRQLEIFFTSLSFKMPENTVFSYWMEGLDSKGSEPGIRRSVSYYGIAPGHYQFRVIARNSDGVWNKTGATIAFTIESYWRETVWFRVIAPLVLLVGIFASIILFLRHRQKLLIERLELLQATEKERARIAADLHDEVGSGLTEVGMTGDFVLRSMTLEGEPLQYVSEMIAKTREMTESLDEIVWAANPVHDSVASFVGYCSRYLQRIMAKMPVKVRFEIEQNLPGTPMSAKVRHQLFLAFRESVSNIVRHAGATDVSLTVARTDDRLTMTIQDNGCGMDLAVTTPDSDGLSNMRNRLEKVGGACVINSELGKGTRIRFEIKL